MKTTLAPLLLSGSAVRRTSVALLIALLGLCAATFGLAQTDDFNDGEDDGWAHYDPLGGLGLGPMAMFGFPGGNSYRISAPARPAALQQAGQARAAALRSSAAYTDFYIEVDLVNWNNSIDQAAGILARVTTPALGTTKGYAFTIQVADTDISIARLDNEAPTDLSGSSKHFVPDPSKDYRMVFIGRGTHFIGRIYELPNVETPVITTTGDDATYASGINGLVIADLTSVSSATGVGADATFDNYRALTAEPPKLSIAYDVGQQGMRISWPGEATGFTLQYSTTLPANVWADAPSDQIVHPFEEPFPNEPDFKYFDFDFTGNKYYRLRQQ
jgi:hypothetical protein